jgi:hypothetical protein
VRYGLPSAGRVRQLDVLDHIGLDVVAAVLAACREAHGARFRVPRWLARLVADGHLGVKSGRGLIAHVPAPVALSELPLAPSARPRTAFARVAVRGPGHLASRFLGALMARPDRRLVVERAEAPALLHALTAGDPRAAETFGPRLDVVEPGALGGDLLLDARDEPLEAKRRALAERAPASPVLVCAPAGALADLLGCVAAPLGLMGAAPGFGGLVELVRGPGAGAFRELLLEAAGRVVDVEDGPVRPLAALAAPRLLEARRVVEEGLVTADALRRVMGGEDLLGEADAWGARALDAVSAAIARLERSVT